MSKPSLSDLAKTISQSAEVLDGFVDSSGVLQLSQADPKIQGARFAAIEASKTFFELLWGPKEKIFNDLTSFFDATVLQFFYRFKILQAIPLDGSMSYSDVSKSCGVDENVLRRLTRRAMTFGYLDEINGQLCHSKCSAGLVRGRNSLNMMGFFTEYNFPSASKTTDTLQKQPKPTEPTGTPFNTAFKTEETLHEYMGRDEVRNGIFSGFMAAATDEPGFRPEFIIRGHPWARYGEATVVDVGGSRGHVSIALAEAYPSLKFIVQDLPDVISGAESGVPEPLKSRIDFQGFDLFQPHPKTEAAVYIMQMILHDWPDPYCVKILRCLVQGMKKGSRILIAEMAVPPRGVLPWTIERQLTSVDLTMLAAHNSRERSIEEFKELVKEADPRLKYVEYQQPPGSVRAFIEFLFDE